ncbi:hypothetical protein ACQEVF_57110 [Nonomuraea polychroma]|uniref:hypothetical protein n=1 Tax=Nonomuraea polychroma TaxID=46176 RepID=UPI003D8EADD9
MPAPSFLRGRRLRATTLDSCGRVVAGLSTLVTKGFVKVEMEPEIEEGEEITQKNAAGEVMLADKGDDSIKWISTEFEFGQVDPALAIMINPTWDRVLDAAGVAVGWAESAEIPTNAGLAVELWMDVKGATSCDDPNAQGSWGYLLLPWLVGGTPGNLTIENNAVSFTYTCRTQLGNRWGVGPYNVMMNGATPHPLRHPLRTNRHRLIMRTGYGPPAVTDGAIQLSVPAAPTIASLVEDPADSTGRTARLTASPGQAGNTIEVEWGDNTPPVNLTAATATSHAYAVPGTYTVLVRDKVNGQVVTQTVVIPFP